VEEMSQLLGGSIPLPRAYIRAEDHLALGRPPPPPSATGNAVILRNHGPVACGRDLPEAMLSLRCWKRRAGYTCRPSARRSPFLPFRTNRWPANGTGTFINTAKKTRDAEGSRTAGLPAAMEGSDGIFSNRSTFAG
jgi:hypothetical protein